MDPGRRPPECRGSHGETAPSQDGDGGGGGRWGAPLWSLSVKGSVLCVAYITSQLLDSVLRRLSVGVRVSLSVRVSVRLSVYLSLCLSPLHPADVLSTCTSLTAIPPIWDLLSLLQYIPQRSFLSFSSTPTPSSNQPATKPPPLVEAVTVFLPSVLDVCPASGSH